MVLKSVRNGPHTHLNGNFDFYWLHLSNPLEVEQNN